MSLPKKPHHLLPPDSTREEYQIMMHSMERIYDLFPDPIDKFLIAFCFELGYTQHVASNCLDVSDFTVSKKIEKIKNVLGRSYNIAE